MQAALTAEGLGETQVDGLLVLIDSSWSFLLEVEKTRRDLLAALEADRVLFDADEEDPEREELLSEIAREMNETRERSIADLGSLVQARRATELEAAFIRAAFRKKGARWDEFKNRLCEALRLSLPSLSSSVAHASIGKGGKTVAQVMDEMRGKQSRNVQAPSGIKTPKSIPVALLEEGDSLESIYSLAAPEDREFLETARAHSFRRWVFALSLLVPEENRARARELAASLSGKTKGQAHATAAYLTGRLYEQAKAKGTDSWADIAWVEAYLEGKRERENENDEVRDEEAPEAEVDPVADAGSRVEVISSPSRRASDPKYDNEAKLRGWRVPEEAMITKAWGHNQPLRGRRMLILEDPEGLHEWRMLERLGGEEQNLTVVERDEEKVSRLRTLLPRAQVFHSNVEDWVVDTGYARMQGKAEQAVLETRRLPLLRSELRSNRDFLAPRMAREIRLPAAWFTWMLRDPRLAIHRAEIGAFLADPLIYGWRNFEVPDDPKGSFDLVSLDTKGHFSSLYLALELLTKMGLLRDDGILCTNFLGQRESEEQQGRYGQAFNVMQFIDNVSHPWTERKREPLKEQRNGISLSLHEMLRSGRGLQGGIGFDNPDSELYMASAEEWPMVDKELILSVLNRIFSSHGNINEQGVPDVPRGDLLKAFKFSAHAVILDTLFHLRCRRVFSPDGALPPRVKKGLEPVKLLPMERWKPLPTMYKADDILSMRDRVGELISTPIYAHTTGERHVVNQTAFEYRASRSTMLTDFIHVRDLWKLCGGEEELYERLRGALVRGTPLRPAVPVSKLTEMGLNGWNLNTEAQVALAQLKREKV